MGGLATVRKARPEIGRGFLILQVGAGWCWRASWHPRGNFGGGWNSGLGVVVGREFRPLATLGVTEGESGRHFDGLWGERWGKSGGSFDGLRANGGRRGDLSTGLGRRWGGAAGTSTGLGRTERGAGAGTSTGSGERRGGGGRPVDALRAKGGRGTIKGPREVGGGTGRRGLSRPGLGRRWRRRSASRLRRREGYPGRRGGSSP